MNCQATKTRLSKLFALLAGSWLLAAAGALADAYYDQGVLLYSQHNFKAAAPYFEASMQSEPNVSNSCYYAALTYQQMGDWARAKQAYRRVVERFPGSEAAGLARIYLQKYDPDFLKKAAGQSSEHVVSPHNLQLTQLLAPHSADYDQLPAEGKIYFQRVGGSQVVDAQLNGRPTPMIFDTGAEACVFGKNHLQQLGINPPSGDPVGQSFGVGSSSGVGTWRMNVNLKVGNIERRNFPVAVQERMDVPPLLGQTFFKDFEYTTDPGARSITFRKKDAARSVADDHYAVPFVREGREMVVNVQVNGHSCPMYFDTGADVVCFSGSQIQNLGITVPEDAQEGLSRGIGGSTKSRSFPIDRMKLGPVEKSNLEICVVENSQLPRPLLGQSFFKDWQFTIDNDRHLIRFLRR